MARSEILQGTGEGLPVEPTDEAGSSHQVIGEASGGALFQEVEGALAGRSRVIAHLWSRGELGTGLGRHRLVESRRQVRRELGRRRPGEEILEGRAHPQRPLDAHLDLDGGQRVQPGGGQRSVGIELRSLHAQGVRRQGHEPRLEPTPPRLEIERRELLATRLPGRLRALGGRGTEGLGGRIPAWTPAGPDAGEDGEPAREPRLATGASAHLPARGPRQRPLPDHDELPGPGRMLLGHRGERIRGGFAGLGLAPARDLVHHHQPLLVAEGDREGGAARGDERRVSGLDAPLDVLRIEVPAAQDDQVLEAAGDEELAAVDEPEIAGAQVSTLVPGESAREGRLLAPAAEVAGGDARSREPDLADLARGEPAGRVGLDDRHLLATPGPAAPDEAAGTPL